MKLRTIAPLAAVFALQGCTAIRADFDHSGGTLGYYADNLIPATSDKMQVYRAAFAFAFFSELGATTIADRSDARAFLYEMQSVAYDIDRLGGHIGAPGCLDAPAAGGDAGAVRDCRELFESDVPKLETHTFKLVVTSVPTDKLSSVWSEVTTQNYLGAAGDIAKFAGGELLAVHNGAGVWRSERKLLTAYLQKDSAFSSIAQCSKLNTTSSSMNSVQDDVACIDAYGAAKGFASADPPDQAIAMFFTMAQDACLSLAPLANGAPPTGESGDTTPLQCAFSYTPTPTKYADTSTAPAGTTPTALGLKTSPAH